MEEENEIAIFFENIFDSEKQKEYINQYKKLFMENEYKSLEDLFLLRDETQENQKKELRKIGITKTPHLKRIMQGLEKLKEIFYKEVSYYKQYHLLPIGIENYKNLDKLNTMRDVELMRNSFLNLGFIVEDPIINEKATKSNITSELEKLRQNLPKESLLVIYFAGHSHKEVANETTYHLCTHEFNQRNLLETSFEIKSFAEMLKSFQSKHILLILDCCFAGSIFHTNEKEEMDDTFVNYFQKGIYAITACGTELLKEQRNKKKSFSYYLSECLNEKGVFSYNFQNQIRKKDSVRNSINIATPFEIVRSIRTKLLEDSKKDIFEKEFPFFPNIGRLGLFCLFVYLFICLFVYLFICLFVICYFLFLHYFIFVDRKWKRYSYNSCG